MTNITVKTGDVFESEAQTLVNTVNRVGVMGKGIALAFKERFPEMYKDYVARCKARKVRLGEPYLYTQLVGPWVLNFPTKDHWRSVSKLSDIVVGLHHLEAHYRQWGIRSLAVPPLGCGHGQLEWRVVGPTLYRHLSRLDIPVELYAPHGTPAEQMDEAFLAGAEEKPLAFGQSLNGSRVSPAAVALVAILSRINRETYHWPIGRTTFQKIAYFATESGIPTGLQYQRGSYGPFAANLKEILARLVNHQLVVERKRGKMFEIKPGPTYRDAREVCKPQLKEWAPVIEHVADLFLRLPRTTDAEIAATVHFAAKELARDRGERPSELDVFDSVRHWKQRRRPPLDDQDLATAIRNLNLIGWVDLAASRELAAAGDEASTRERVCAQARKHESTQARSTAYVNSSFVPHNWERIIAAYKILGSAMSRRPPPKGDQQPDLFCACFADIPIRDQRDMMERPFFSLAKKPRHRPIEYEVGDVFVKVSPNKEHGIATIWDADALIWAATQITEALDRGVEPSRTLEFHPYNLLKAIRRSTGGKDYERLRAALDRLSGTLVKTNIRVRGKNKKHATFHWLEGWTETIDDRTGETIVMTITIPDWLYQGIIRAGGVLTIHEDYFLLTGGIERWLYRVARKHAGMQDLGWQFTMRQLYNKSGSAARFSDFALDVRKVVKTNNLPEYTLELTRNEEGEEIVRFLRRSKLDVMHPEFEAPRARRRRVGQGIYSGPWRPGPLITAE